MMDARDNTDEEAQAGYSEPATFEDWESLSTHPDPEDDLGYGTIEWEVIKTPSHSDHYVYLPTDEELLEDATFIVAGPDGRCDLADRR
jgi:hypothetical protein